MTESKQVTFRTLRAAESYARTLNASRDRVGVVFAPCVADDGESYAVAAYTASHSLGTLTTSGIE